MTTIIPEMTELSRPYWDGAREHKLMLQYCSDCNACWHPPMPCCPQCHSMRYEWRASPGRGVVYSYIDVHHSVHPVTDSWVPYRVCLIDLDEGPRIISSWRHDIANSGLVPDARVEVVFDEISPGVVLPRFSAQEHA
jgi:uncharacterized OB-fold protein